MAQKRDEILDHEYDGIREFDNPIPAWWNWIFVGTFVFSIVYFTYYHLIGAPGVIASYEVEMAAYREAEAARAAELAKNVSEDILLALMANSEEVEAGKATYAGKCAACHAEGGQGLIGPNLTDAYWLHADGSLMAIRTIVHDGVAAKGMPPWGKILTPQELHQVVAFLGTLRGTNLEGKEPQGKKIAADAAPTEASEGAEEADDAGAEDEEEGKDESAALVQ